MNIPPIWWNHFPKSPSSTPKVSPLRSLAGAPTSRPSSNELQAVHTRRSVSYNLEPWNIPPGW